MHYIHRIELFASSNIYIRLDLIVHSSYKSSNNKQNLFSFIPKLIFIKVNIYFSFYKKLIEGSGVIIVFIG
jgi:hypothetical protein